MGRIDGDGKGEGTESKIKIKIKIKSKIKSKIGSRIGNTPPTSLKGGINFPPARRLVRAS
jgi:hypothetical protein